MDNQTIRKKLKCAGRDHFVRRILDYVGAGAGVGVGVGVGEQHIKQKKDIFAIKAIHL